MLKETVISIIIVILIFMGDTITQNYTKNTVKEMESELESVKTQIEKMSSNEDVHNNLNESIKNLQNKWKEKHNKLAYYIEHDEIEKVDNNLVGLETNLNTKEYEQAMVNLEESKFILGHIEEKYAFNLKNIF